MSGFRLPDGLELVCSGCGLVVAEPTVVACPANRHDGTPDDIDHRLEIPDFAVTETARALGPPTLLEDANPFVAFRHRFYSYALARRLGLSDDDYVGIVVALDAAVAEVDGQGFIRTPLTEEAELARACGLADGVRLWVKDETGNVSGSHKARHLMGVMVHQRVLEMAGCAPPQPALLAISSCGNAALGAAVVARAAGRSLAVFVPEWVAGSTRDRLVALGAEVHVCSRQSGELGDPCHHGFRAALADGALAFATQGSENALTLEGGATIGYELASSLSALDAVFVQVGGGALAASVALGLRRARRGGEGNRLAALWVVQSASMHPLQRALRRAIALILPELRSGRPIAELVDEALNRLARQRTQAMTPWPTEPQSVASGILDDETYDWRPLVRAILASSGGLVLATEDHFTRANDLARRHTSSNVDHTGTAGLAGLMARNEGGHLDPGNVVVLFTGAARG